MAGRTTAALTVAICLPFLAGCVGGGAPAVHLHDDAVGTEPLGAVGIDSWSPEVGAMSTGRLPELSGRRGSGADGPPS